MANFGFGDLRVVTPFEAAWREAKSAVEAASVMDSAREFPNLAKALADRSLILGTATSRYRRPGQPHYFLPQATPIVHAALTAGGRVAIVFGSEKYGLTRENLSLCHALVEIPTAPAQPSMNLGQSVAVCLYELATKLPPPIAPTEPEPQTATPPTTAELERLADNILSVARLSNYSPAAMESANREDLRLLLRRWQLTPLDIRRALGLFRRVAWHLRQRRGS